MGLPSTEAHRIHKPNPEVGVNAVSVRWLRVPPLSAQVIECELNASVMKTGSIGKSRGVISEKKAMVKCRGCTGHCDVKY